MNLRLFQKSSTGEMLHPPPEQLVTIAKTDPQFRSYIDGTFSKDRLALPTKNLNLNSTMETVTFRLVDQKHIHRPNVGKLAWVLIRGSLTFMILGPWLGVLALLKSHATPFSFITFSLAGLTLWLLQNAVFLYNDFVDHTEGADRLVSDDRRRYLQKGWIRPIHVLRISQVALLLGVFIGGILVARDPIILSIISLAAAIGIFGYSFPNRGLKALGLGELAIFWCFGPLVSVGLQYLLTQRLTFEFFLIGSLFGHANVTTIQFRQLESCWSDAVGKVGTFAVRLGFDRSKSFLMIQLIAQSLIACGIFLFLRLDYPALIFWVFYSMGLAYLFAKLRRIASPMGSGLSGMSRKLAWLSAFYALANAIYFYAVA